MYTYNTVVDKVALLALLIIFVPCEVLEFSQEVIDIVFDESIISWLKDKTEYPWVEPAAPLDREL